MEESDQFIVIPQLHNQEFSTLWLRDNCRCSECYNHLTNQRSVDISALGPQSFVCEFLIEGRKLFVSWRDGHKSDFDLAFLEHCSQAEKHPELVLWNGNEMNSNFIKTKLRNSNKDDEKQVVHSILKYGIAIVTDVEPSFEATQKTIETIAPIQHTLFGGMWELTNNLEHFDTAYLKTALSIHTDNTYFLDSAGLQIFHCLRHDGEGGETVLVDGFNAIKKLELQDKESYKILSETAIECEFIEPNQHQKMISPVIKHRPGTQDLEQIRFNIYDRSPKILLPARKVNAFYKAYGKLNDILRKPEHEWRIKLTPGNVLFMNNWRVLHGRTAYTGHRKLVGSYIKMGDFLSKARLLKLIL